LSVPMETEVLVVGGGPGGSAAAYHLARHGVDVTLVEKAVYPREKVCGDGLTPRGVAPLLRMGIEPGLEGFERVVGLRVYTRDRALELRWPEVAGFPDYGLVMPRAGLDDLLARRARAAGARLLERTEALGPIVEDHWVVGGRVRPQGGEEASIRARFVLAADGAASRFALQAGVRRDPSRPLGIAARRYYRAPRRPGPWLESWLDLWDGRSLLPGYGWLFAVADGTVNVGAGLLNTFRDFSRISAQHALDTFVRILPGAWGISEETAVGRTMSGPLPMGMSRRPSAVPGMLVIGDAAGVVNPFNGEGIAYAMETAEIASELATEALLRDRPGIAHQYPIVLRERYGRYFRLGREFVNLIGNPRVMRAAVKYGMPRERLMRFLLKLMANLSDGRQGGMDDRVIRALERLAPAS